MQLYAVTARALPGPSLDRRASVASKGDCALGNSSKPLRIGTLLGAWVPALSPLPHVAIISP